MTLHPQLYIENVHPLARLSAHALASQKMPKTNAQLLHTPISLEPPRKRFKQRTPTVPRVVVTIRFDSAKHAAAALDSVNQMRMWVNYDAILKEEITIAAQVNDTMLILVFFALTDLNTLRQNFDATFPQILPPSSSWAYNMTACCNPH